MTAPPNNPHVARVVLYTTRDTRHMLNVLHCATASDSVLSSTDLTNMANTVADWWQNSYRQSCSPSQVGEQVVATKLDPADPLQATVYINGPGTQGLGPEPAGTTVAVSWRTGLAGRKYRGRFYHLSTPTNNVTPADGIIGSWQLSLTGVAQYLLNHLVTNGLKAVIFHRASDTYTGVLGTVVEGLLDSQRRRLAERGF